MKTELYARKLNNELIFSDLNALNNFLSKVEDKDEIHLKITTVKDSKSLEQLRLLYRIYGIIADYTGDSVHRTHLYLKEKFLPPEIIEVRDLMIVECQTLSTISKKDMALYITKVIDWAQLELNLTVVAQEDWDLLK